MIRNMGRTAAAALAALWVFTACNTKTDSEDETEIHAEHNLHTRTAWLAEIDSLEAIVYTDTFDVDNKATSELLRSYLSYAKVFVGDKEHTPKFLYKAAALSRAVGLPVKAIKLYERILTDYPTWEKAPETAFLLAYTYDDDLKEPQRAREAYEEVVEKYQGDHWALQAQERLKTVDMTDEELIREFNKRNNSNTDQAPEEGKPGAKEAS